MSDESLREFQLNGKQLVFLFMASTVVAVVIFLCGVMVGRGVSAAQATLVTNSTVETGDPTAGLVPEASSALSTAAPADVPPDAPGDDPLQYPGILNGAGPKPDLEPVGASTKSTTPRAPVVSPKAPSVTAIKAPAPAAPTPRPPAAVPAPASSVAAPSVPAESAVNAEPAGAGFVVQVVATPRRSEAESISLRLQKKGYPAFVTTAGKAYRVRVGKYKDRAEANAVSKRLETEERFRPWVTR